MNNDIGRIWQNWSNVAVSSTTQKGERIEGLLSELSQQMATNQMLRKKLKTIQQTISRLHCSINGNTQ